MDNINNARGLLAYDSNVVRAPKNYLAPSLLIALAGAAFAGSTQAGENDTLMMFLAIASIAMAATGLYMMFSRLRPHRRRAAQIRAVFRHRER